MQTAVSLNQTLQSAAPLEERFLPIAREVKRSGKGVRPSEMFFACAGIAAVDPPLILESGTATGQSTWQTARLFPDKNIITWDLPDSPLAEKARKRLGDCDNVEIRHGDSRREIAAEARPGVPVIIDGPKSFRALRMAFELLSTGNPPAVYIHDFRRGLPERRFLEKFCPEAFYSDDPAWVWHYRYLDAKEPGEPVRQEGPPPEPGSPTQGYGATFVCLPRRLDVTGSHYKKLIFRRGLRRLATLFPEKILGQKPAMPEKVED
jgi:hypothetical protein